MYRYSFSFVLNAIKVKNPTSLFTINTIECGLTVVDSIIKPLILNQKFEF